MAISVKFEECAFLLLLLLWTFVRLVEGQIMIADIDIMGISNTIASYIGSKETAWMLFTSGLATGGVVYVWSIGFPTKLPRGVRLHSQGQEVPGVPNSLTCLLIPLNESIPVSLNENIQTLKDLVYNSGASQNSLMFGFRTAPPNAYNYQWYTYGDAQQMVMLFSSGLSLMGYKSGRYVYFGSYVRISIEATIAEFSCYMMGFIFVPIHDIFGFQNMSKMISSTKVHIILVDQYYKAEFLLTYPPSSLKTLIVTFELNKSLRILAKRKFIRLRTFVEVQQLGERKVLALENLKEIEQSRYATLFFSERVPNDLDGIILKHSHILSGATAINLHLDKYSLKENDVYFSYLPRRHVMDVTWRAAILMKKGRIGFSSKDNRDLMEDMKILRPTIVLVVPRILDRVYDRVQSLLATKGIDNRVCRMGINSKLRYLSRGIVNRDTIWDRILFRKLRGRFGNNVRLMVIAGAMVNSDVLTFTRCYIGCDVVVAYETAISSGISTMTYPGDETTESAGVPVPGTFINLMDTDRYQEMEPDPDGKHHSPVGEICVGGPNVTNTVFNNRFGIRKASGDSFPTGDLGRILQNGTLQIIGRADENMKISIGEWLIPGRLEAIFEKKCRSVVQILIYTERYQSICVAIVFPDFSVIRSTCAGEFNDETKESLSENSFAVDIVLKEMAYVARAALLKEYEFPKAIKLVTKPLYGLGTGLLAFRPKQQVIELYQEELKSLLSIAGTAKILKGIL